MSGNKLQVGISKKLNNCIKHRRGRVKPPSTFPMCTGLAQLLISSGSKRLPILTMYNYIRYIVPWSVFYCIFVLAQWYSWYDCCWEQDSKNNITFFWNMQQLQPTHTGNYSYNCNSMYEMSTNLREVRNGVRGDTKEDIIVHVNVKCVDFYAVHKCGNYGYKFIYATKCSYHCADLCETYSHSVTYNGQMCSKFYQNQTEYA